MKQQILLIHALRHPRSVEAHASAAYNPAGDGHEYHYAGNYAHQFLEIHTDLLVGREFWETIGDLDTYDELLEVSEEVGAAVDGVIRATLDRG